MPLAKISSYVFVVSMFGVLAIWGYLPAAWSSDWPVLVLLAISFLSLVLWGVFSLEALRLWFKKRSTQYAIGLGVTAVGALLILGTINYLASSYNVKKDLTKNQLHTLSEQSQKIAGELKEEVTIRVWTTGLERMSSNIDVRKFLENYRIAGHGKIKLEIKNPNQDKLEATKDNIKRDNLIVVRSASGREARIESFNDTKGESQITNAIVQAIKGAGKKMLCFLSGHGEASLQDSQAEGISMIKEKLADSSYDSKEITLATSDAVPADCEVVVIPGPKGDALEKETKALNEFLTKGGKMIALFSPGAPASWKSLSSAYGVEVRSDLVIDPRVQPPIAVATKNFAQDIEVTRAFNRLVILPETSSIQVPTVSKDGKSSIKTFVSSEAYTYAKTGTPRTIRTVQKVSGDSSGPFSIGVLISRPIEKTATNAPATPAPKIEAPKDPKASHGWNWLIREANAQETPSMDDEPDAIPGQITGGVVAPKNKDEMQLILFSNSSFIQNSFLTQMGNADLFLNAVNYLMKDNDLIGIRPRELRQASLELSLERLRKVYATVLLIAGTFLVLGIRAGRRRSAT